MRVALKNINRVTKRLSDGTLRVYYYHRQTRVRLPDDPTSPAFLEAYRKAEEITPRDVGTVGSLIRGYLSGYEFNRRADSTKAEYKRMLARCEDAFGDMPIVALGAARVRRDFLDWRDDIARKSPREADHRLTVLARVFSWAMDRGEIERNPLDKFPRVYGSDRSQMIWTEHDVKRFMAKAPLEMQQALMLALHTGQRQGDLRALTWNAYDGQTITLRQSKRGRQVVIPCTKALRDMLDGMPRGDAVTVLTTATGRPWQKRHFARTWEKASTAAGIEGLHFHDLRGTAVTMLSLAGCEPQEIATITGHSLRRAHDIIEAYLARTRGLAEAAIYKFENAEATKFANRLQTGASQANGGRRK